MKPGLTTWPAASSTRSPSQPGAHGGDAAAGHGHIGRTARGTCAVDDGAPTDDDVGAHGPHRRSPGRRAHARVPNCRPVRIPWVGRTPAATAATGCRRAERDWSCTWQFGFSGRRHRSRSLRTPCRSPAPSSPPPTAPRRSSWSTAGRAPHGLGLVRDQYARKIRKSPTIRMVPELDDGPRTAPLLRRLGQRARPRSRRPGLATRSGPSTSTGSSPVAACTGARAPAWPSNWAGA